MNDKQNALEIIHFGQPEKVMTHIPSYSIAYHGSNHQGYDDVGIANEHDRPVGSKWTDIWGTGWYKEYPDAEVLLVPLCRRSVNIYPVLALPKTIFPSLARQSEVMPSVAALGIPALQIDRRSPQMICRWKVAKLMCPTKNRKALDQYAGFLDAKKRSLREAKM